MSGLTPKQIVEELNRFVVGQNEAKRAVAVALRNRWRRKQIKGDIKDEIMPHNILMVGPTGVGKTEIARRLAKLTNSPFIKVEATKFTEVGYVGRDVESIIRDLVDVALNLVRSDMRSRVKEQAENATETRILKAVVGDNPSSETIEKFAKKLRNGELDQSEIEIVVTENPTSSIPSFDIPGMQGVQGSILNLGDVLGKMLGGGRPKLMKMKLKDAYEQVLKEESDKLLDEDKIVKHALALVESEGIVFIDEIDKIASQTQMRGEVSREGVQRDLLPLIEGTAVNTKYGPVKTEHILFITSGAFHLAKPSDLLPELQGRLPIRVEFSSLTEKDLVAILKEPEHSLLKQYTALLEIEDVNIIFTEDGIESMAQIAAHINRDVEDIGARRLRTIIEKLLEGVNFTANETPGVKIVVDRKYVEANLAEVIKDVDLSRFIL
jgi:ATP-dependent HslUV protease ATP-binding subunit HslU